MTTEAPAGIRDRVRELRRVKASSLKPHPLNWRTHGKAQRAAIAGVLEEIGYADALLARELPDGSRPWLTGRSESSVFEIARPKASPDHPTSKPVALVASHMRNSSKPNAIVLDLFGGSGTTLVAAQHLGRRCVSIEIEPRYVDVIVKRYQALTGDRGQNLERPEARVA